MTVPTLEAVQNVEGELYLTNKRYTILISICMATPTSQALWVYYTETFSDL